MRKINVNKNWLTLGAAMLLGATAFFMANMFLTNKEKQISEDFAAANKQVMISAIVPTVDLNSGDTLTAEVLAARDVPADYYSANGVFSSDNGLSINTKTGRINFKNSIPGLYEVNYKTIFPNNN